MEHDKVIKFIEQDLSRRYSAKYKVLTNVRGSRDWHIGDLFPDIIILSRDNDAVLFIVEVETADSIADKETVQQWKKYASLPGTFYAIVPNHELEKAKNLASLNDVKIRFGSYRYSDNNVTTVEYES